MNTLFRSMLVVAVLVDARAAHALCLITGLRPDAAMLPTMDVGQEFSFVATDDCVELRFHVEGTKLTKIPRSGPDGSSKDATYKVLLTEREWNTVADGEDALTWSIMGTTSAGETTRMTQTNAIDHDLHFALSVSAADGKITGESPSDGAGTSVSSAGDVNGDEIDDVLIGAPGKGDGRGAAYVVAGPVSGNVDLLLAAFLGAEEDEAGTSVSGVGDVDDDGYDDLLIGAPGNNGNVGAAYLLYGPMRGRPTPADADVKLVGEGPGEDFAGFSVSGAGDVTGDGTPDLLVGSFLDATERTGAAYLVSGATLTGATFELSDAYAKLLGPTRTDTPGQGVKVTRAGDLDGDGHDDLAVGVDWNDEFGVAGKTFATLNHEDMEFSGTSGAGVIEFLQESGDDAASAVAGAGDFDNDGYGDLLIGASDNNSGRRMAGAAYLILSPFDGTKSDEIELADADVKFVGEAPGDRAGAAVSSAGDVDADGYADILIGACRNNDGAGAAYLVLGGDIEGTIELGLSRSDVKLMGAAPHDCAGFSVSSAGDLDMDGNADVLVGAPQSSDAAGVTYVFGGATLSPLMVGSP